MYTMIGWYTLRYWLSGLHSNLEQQAYHLLQLDSTLMTQPLLVTPAHV